MTPHDWRLESTAGEMVRPAMTAARQFPWKFFFQMVLIGVFGSAGVVFGLVQWLRSDLPSPEKLAVLETPVKTTVYDVRGKVLHEFYRENRSVVPLNRIPRHLVNATLSTEDRNFYKHWGVDLWGVGRAVVTDVMHMRRAQGGSTITQQLARNLFNMYEKSFTRKLKELVLALDLERTYSKDQILELYFNQIYFGEGAYGVESAAKTYFGKPLSELTLPECALIAGIPANPTVYSPRRKPEAAKARRAKVLRNMLATKAISQVEFDRAMAAPLGVTSTRYTNDRAPYFVEMIRLNLDEKYGSNAVYEGGLKVYTTLDMDLQALTDRALERHIAQLEKDMKLKRTRGTYQAAVKAGKVATGARTPYLQGAVVAIDPRSGAIRALSGGRDWNESNFNRAVQALRQPGSSFKPFVYTAALDNGFKPTDVVVDEPVTFPGGDGKAYEPQNYDRKFRGPITLRHALEESVNIPAIKLLRKVGTSLVASYARRMGIKSTLGQNLSLALGSSEVNLLELTSAYGVFANKGVRNDPIYILKVQDKDGRELERNTARPYEVLSEGTAAVMTSMLESVMNHGTGWPARAAGLTVPAAGKTGTMDDYMDAWFVGYIPSLCVGVWVGYDEKRPIGPGMTGARAALPIWTEIMLGATRGKSPEDFPTPLGTTHRIVCTESAMLATDQCPSYSNEMFDEGTEPADYCNTHPGRPLDPATRRFSRPDSTQAPPEFDAKPGREEIHI
jgi:penicillin-binding protein 1A